MLVSCYLFFQRDYWSRAFCQTTHLISLYFYSLSINSPIKEWEDRMNRRESNFWTLLVNNFICIFFSFIHVIQKPGGSHPCLEVNRIHILKRNLQNSQEIKPERRIHITESKVHSRTTHIQLFLIITPDKKVAW